MKEGLKGSFKKQLWMSFGIIFGTVVIVSIGLYFLSSNLDAQASKIIADKALIARQVALLGSLAELKEDAPQAAAYTTAANTLLPSRDELINFPQWLTTLGQSHNVSVSFSFQGGTVPATDAAPGSDGFSLTVNGAIADLSAFLDDLEVHAPFLVTIDSFDLVNNGAAGYRLSAQGKVFSQ